MRPYQPDTISHRPVHATEPQQQQYLWVVTKYNSSNVNEAAVNSVYDVRCGCSVIILMEMTPSPTPTPSYHIITVINKQEPSIKSGTSTKLHTLGANFVMNAYANPQCWYPWNVLIVTQYGSFLLDEANLLDTQFKRTP